MKNPACGISKIDQLNSLYLGLNGSLPEFQKIEVRQAIKWAIDYDAIADNITPNVWGVWQTFLPKGTPGSIPDRPFKKDVAKAQALLAAAGYPDGFDIVLDYRRSDIAAAVQHDLATVRHPAQLLAGETKQVTTKIVFLLQSAQVWTTRKGCPDPAWPDAGLHQLRGHHEGLPQNRLNSLCSTPGPPTAFDSS